MLIMKSIMNKTISNSIYLIILCLLFNIGCSKSDHLEQNVMRASLNGNLVEFEVRNAKEFPGNQGFYEIHGTICDNARRRLIFSVPIAVGVYEEFDTRVTYNTNWAPACGGSIGSGYMWEVNEVLVTITSLTAQRVKGSFNIVVSSPLDNLTTTISNGEFDLKIE